MKVTLLPFVYIQTALLHFFIWVQIAAFFTIIPTALSKSVVYNGTNNDIDRVALLTIKSMISDDPFGVTSSWNDSLHFCQWQGVICSHRHQRVTVLDLSSKNLVGSLSPWIGNMSFLRLIWLQNNSLYGEIPQQVGRLFRLQELRLHNNSFVGNIPSNLSYCSKLEVLHLGGNKLVGKIPYGFGSLTMLRVLIIHSNNLTGGIPCFIGNLTSLVTLSLGACHLSGSIPDVFHRLNNLKRLAFAENELVGTIPPSVYNLSLLESLYLDINKLHGTLPTNFASLQPRLQELSLLDNQFTGPLPASIFNSTELGRLDVSRNKFSGKVDFRYRHICELVAVSLGFNQFGSGESDEMIFIETLSNCSNLEILNLENNNFRGILPASLERFSTKLYYLNLASNSFSGRIPSSIGNLSGLSTLDLSYNHFIGTIPVSMGELQNLRRLELTDNNFSGQIPGSLGNLSFLIELHLPMNKLNGTIPSSLGNCNKLIVLRLDQNHLSGIIPKNLFGLSSLSISLNLGSNQLSGQLPFDVGNDLKNLNELILAENRLSGQLPSSLGSCSSLQNLDIRSNFFQGSLPPSLGSLRALQNLDVSCNNFTGQIPRSLEMIHLENLNISFNGFEGEVSSKGVFANASAITIKGNIGLCGGIPELYLPKCSPKNSKERNKLSLAVILIISFVAFLFCAATVSIVFFYARKKKDEDEQDTNNFIPEMPLINVSYKMLYNATEGFSQNNVVGKGSFSLVYRGDLGLDGGIVAVKVLDLDHQGGSKSFIFECEALRNARHRNLVKIITCCSGYDSKGKEFKALVYEFMPNGNLDTWLHSSHQIQSELPRLNLLQRVCIALDVAYALDYLHNHSGRTIVHCDLKPSNILLDEDMVANVGDFGLSKIFQSENLNTYDTSSTGLRGTIGYAAPEYGLGSKVSTSGDIYSYGILLLEMMTSKRPTNPMFKEGLNLQNYAEKAMDDHLLENVDPILLNNDCRDLAVTNNITSGKGTSMRTEVVLRLMLELGVACSMESPQHRMNINSVIQELRFIKGVIVGI